MRSNVFAAVTMATALLSAGPTRAASPTTTSDASPAVLQQLQAKTWNGYAEQPYTKKHVPVSAHFNADGTVTLTRDGGPPYTRPATIYPGHVQWPTMTGSAAYIMDTTSVAAGMLDGYTQGTGPAKLIVKLRASSSR